MRNPVTILISMFVLTIGPALNASGQSSSLYMLDEQQTQSSMQREANVLSPAIAANSFIAVQVPEPRKFAEHDLVTIIIRESFQTDLKSSLDTEKKVKVNGEVSEFIDLDKLLKLMVKPNTFSADGTPKVGVDYDNKWEGNGDYSRSESMTGRMTARVADVKPNGTIILEARQTMIHDKEELTIVLTGTCRASDIAVDNTVLSTQLYDLHLSKQHKGELKQSTNKGFIAKFIEAIFAF